MARPANLRLARPALPAGGVYEGTRVVINIPSGGATGDVESTAASVTDAGFPNVERARVPVAMNTPQVRYFHAADAEAARALAMATGAISRDFTSHSPAPRTGYLELWLEGTAPARTAAASTAEDRILGILRDRATRN